MSYTYGGSSAEFSILTPGVNPVSLQPVPLLELLYVDGINYDYRLWQLHHGGLLPRSVPFDGAQYREVFYSGGNYHYAVGTTDNVAPPVATITQLDTAAILSSVPFLSPADIAGGYVSFGAVGYEDQAPTVPLFWKARINTAETP